MNCLKITDINLVPDILNPTPDYYCTWQTQLYATNDGKPQKQRECINENSLFNPAKPFGWAYFYEKARRDLILVMDDSWDVPMENYAPYYGSLILNKEKFPGFVGENNADSLKNLSDKIKSIGWKGLGGWVCSQESGLFFDGKTSEEYWSERLTEADKSGFAYWKVDWGEKGGDFEFRKMLTDLAHKLAPDLVVEQAVIKSIVPNSDVFRSYDVPAIMSIPMTMEKLKEFTTVGKTEEGYRGLINCEDEAYIAAAGGFSMGIMRHPYSGDFINGEADMSFPAVHRNLKTKLYEVLRAVRWHRIAPAFGVDADETYISNELLSDSWRLENVKAEIEEWWLHNPLIEGFLNDNIITKTGCAAISRRMKLPKVVPDENGDIPYIVASKNPNGAVSVATLGRTRGRNYWIPECEVEIDAEGAEIIGVFGEYEKLIIKNCRKKIGKVLMQDLADENAYDITELVEMSENRIIIPGDLIKRIGRISQPDNDSSEPGVVVKIAESI